ncbi:MAG TPA: DUF58 domain-containing protein [Polyangiaceae bacterium]|nr:DUF58 domain-containing protein [Polyangiaceae bacterium]
MSNALKRQLDWGSLVPLRLKAQTIADGIWAGSHRSPRKGSGIEFGGHRDYVPGDDLRWLDRHALMRHGKLMVRQFETETDRTLILLLDASRSMAYSSKRAPAAKLAFAALLAAALSKLALAGGDPVGIDWLGGDENRPQKPSAGRETFDRIVDLLESAAPGQSPDDASLGRALARVARSARRGSVIVLLSDLLDLPETAAEAFSALAAHDRTLLAVRVLDPVEAEFPFDEPVRLRAAEGNAVVETDGQSARQGYLEALEALAQRWHEQLVPRGGRLVRAITTDDPIAVVRQILLALESRST